MAHLSVVTVLCMGQVFSQSELGYLLAICVYHCYLLSMYIYRATVTAALVVHDIDLHYIVIIVLYHIII